MMRLIDADSLLKHACDVYGVYDDSCAVPAVFIQYIKGAPTVDAVPVIRCRDCRHRGTDECPAHINGRPADDDYCSHGERNDGKTVLGV